MDRNELYGYGVEHEAPAQVIAVQTRVNLPEVHLASMSDQDLETYRKLLEELRELLPPDEPKRIGSVSPYARTPPASDSFVPGRPGV